MSSREEFEQWLKDERLDHCRLSSVIGWKAWQAAREQDAGEAVAKAYISATSEGVVLDWQPQVDAPTYSPLYARPPKAESLWIKCNEQLPEPFPRDRKHRAGILIRFQDGRVNHLLEVGDYLISVMKNGPRQPMKFEAPSPPRITHWMPIRQPQKE